MIISAGLGGAALALSEMAATSGIPSLLIATQPFGFEDALRQARARQVLDALTQARRHLLKIDLNALLTAKNQENTLADGPSVAREAFPQALHHPLLRQTLRESEHLSGISVTIRSAQGNLRLAVMQALRAHCGEDVPMLFDTNAHPRFGERLQVSLWSMRRVV